MFVDRQLAGPYGRQEGHYNSPPFMKGMKQQGPQAAGARQRTIARRSPRSIAIATAKYAGKAFAELSDSDKDEVLKGLEEGKIELGRRRRQGVLRANPEGHPAGFFADPIYGGNRDMVAWKMIGYPGARYNYLDWIDRHNERFPLPPVSITGRAEWTPKGR